MIADLSDLSRRLYVCQHQSLFTETDEWRMNGIGWYIREQTL